jgi:dihydrofolate reductase
MGRKTWDSLPPRFRPLPGRRNIVVTRQADWAAAGAFKAASLAEAVSLCHDAPRAWVIGGADLYVQAAPIARVAEVTEIEQAFDGDAFAPHLDEAWREVSPHPPRFGLGPCLQFRHLPPRRALTCPEPVSTSTVPTTTSSNTPPSTPPRGTARAA